MNATPDDIELFLQDCDELYGCLREGRGLDETLFESALSRLRRLKEECGDSQLIPKPLAAALFDLSTALYSSAHIYPDELRMRLDARFDEFCDAARDLLNS